MGLATGVGIFSDALVLICGAEADTVARDDCIGADEGAEVARSAGDDGRGGGASGRVTSVTPIERASNARLHCREF